MINGRRYAGVANQNVLGQAQDLGRDEQIPGRAGEVHDLDDVYRPKPAGRNEQTDDRQHDAPQDDRCQSDEDIGAPIVKIFAAGIGVRHREAVGDLFRPAKLHGDAMDGLMQDQIDDRQKRDEKEPQRDGKSFVYPGEQR